MDASKDERDFAAQLMRKKTLASLTDLFVKTSGETEKHYVQNGWIIPQRTADEDNNKALHKSEKEKDASDDVETIPPTQSRMEIQYETQGNQELASQLDRNGNEMED